SGSVSRVLAEAPSEAHTRPRSNIPRPGQAPKVRWGCFREIGCSEKRCTHSPVAGRKTLDTRFRKHRRAHTRRAIESTKGGMNGEAEGAVVRSARIGLLRSPEDHVPISRSDCGPFRDDRL